MDTRNISVKRHIVTTRSDFDAVLRSLYAGIGTPSHDTLADILVEPDFNRFQRRVMDVAGTSGLIEFAKLDLGDALVKGPHSNAYRIIRIVAGNPLIMRKMIETVPHAGSYAPITILVYEDGSDVKLAYDTMESCIETYGSEGALRIARELDQKVLSLLESAAE